MLGLTLDKSNVCTLKMFSVKNWVACKMLILEKLPKNFIFGLTFEINNAIIGKPYLSLLDEIQILGMQSI